MRDEKKRRGLYSYLRNQKCDIILLQETHCKLKKEEYRWGKEWEGQTVWSRGTSNSKGVSVMFSSGTKYDIIKTVVDPNGRYISCKVKFGEIVYNIINIYAPNHEYERVKFFNEMHEMLQSDGDNDNVIVLAGDFNCVISNDLDRKNCSSCVDVGQVDVKNLMDAFQLEDIWRRRNPDKFEPSWESRGKMSRIDYFLISEILDSQVKETLYLNAPFSDHRPVFLKITTCETKRGPGIWKMNVETIKSNLFKDAFESMWNDWIKQQSKYRIDIWWDLGKKRIRELAKNISKILARQKNEEIMQINNRITFLRETSGNLGEIQQLETRLKDIHEQKGIGTKIRSRTRWWEEGEKSTRYFHNLEKKRGKDKLWESILDAEEKEVHGTEAIQKCQVEFYKNLYKKQELPHNETHYDFFLNDLGCKLSPENKLLLEDDISLKELTKALHFMKNNKSPGPDGIVVEFYKLYWNKIKKDFWQVLKVGLESKRLNYSQYLAVIVLLYKKGNRADIKNWRPISLLNTDYKILSKALAMRLKTVMSDVISTDQRGCIANRYIGENIRLVEDIIEEKDDDSVIMLLDQEKAFDRVEWNWLFAVLHAFDFPEKFISWIRTMYEYAKTSILTNGVQSEFFNITRGIRQGDAMSALLYIIQAEPLATKIKCSDEIKGIIIENHMEKSEVKVAQYVDDTCIFLKNKEYILPCLEIIEIFEKASGSKLNRSKTKALKVKEENTEIYEGITLTSGPEMVLGVPMGKYDLAFWQKLLKKLETNLNIWMSRDLSFEGKIHVIRSLGISTLIYALEMKNIDNSFINSVMGLLWKFLWSGKRYTVKREICFLPRQLGGLNMIDVYAIIKVKRIKTLVQILKGTTNDTWKILPMKYFSVLDDDFKLDLFALRVTDLKVLLERSEIPIYYKDMILTFQELCRKYKCTESQNEIIWCNHGIQFQGKPLAYKHWSKCGVQFLSDILTNGNIDREKVYSKLTIKAAFLFEIERLKKALPNEWKTRPIGTTSTSILDFVFKFPDGTKKNLASLTSKDIYHLFIYTSNEVNSSKNYWSKMSNDADIVWKIWYSSNFMNRLLPRKICDFNWKIFYGQINTEKRLKHMKFSDSICKICHVEVENLEHLLMQCNCIMDIWKNIESLLKQLIPDIQLNRMIILGGYFKECPENLFVNLLLGICRWNIWKRRNVIKYEAMNITVNECLRIVLFEIKSHCKILLNMKKLDSSTKQLILWLLERI